MDRQEIIKAFHMMWDNFPEPIMLITKDRQIHAVNRKAASLGFNKQMKCSSIGKPENHKGCLCNQAADTKEAAYKAYEGAFGRAYGFWIPVARAEANGTMMYYALARLAKEQGHDDIAEELIISANQEAIHARFYAVLNGKYPQDFWNLLRTVQKGKSMARYRSRLWPIKYGQQVLLRLLMRWKSLRSRKVIMVWLSARSWRSISQRRKLRQGKSISVRSVALSTKGI